MAWNRHVFRSEFGLELEQIFQDFDCNPSGSGTVAQVHRAWLRKNGLEVAVKICHPHIEEHIERDLQLMKIMAEVAHLIPLFKNLNLPEEVVYFSQMMRQQLDLRREAYALDHFSRNFLYWKNVHVPVPVYPFVSSHVLTETFATGTTVSAFSCDSLEETLTGPEREVWTLVKTQIATIGLQSFLQMLLWDNFVHADLHPGNILVRFANRKGKVYWSDCPSKELVHLIIQEDLIPQLVYLDTGLVTQLSRRDFQNFNDLFTALVLHGDGYRAGQLIIERCPMPYRARVVDPDGFCQSMDKIIQPIFRNVSLKLKSFAIAPVIFQVFDLVRDHRVHLDGSFTNLVMSFACVEGLGRQLSPDLNLIPFLASAALQYLVTNVAFKIDQIRDNL
jgi:aarF domain-containing kinase